MVEFCNRSFFSAALAMLTFVIVGCDSSGGFKEGDAASSDTMKSAIAAERIGNFDEAIALYKEVIDNYKDPYLANLQMALLLHEYKHDYLGAIFHYREYLSGRGEKSKRDVNAVSERIEKAEQFLSAYYVKKTSESSGSEIVEMSARIAELDKQLITQNSKISTLNSSNEVLRAEITRLNGEIERQKHWIRSIQSSPDAAGSGSSNGRIGTQQITDADGSTRIVNTYEVRAGDNLSIIAQYVYGDSTMWPKIRDANPDKIKNDRVRVGEILIIP